MKADTRERELQHPGRTAEEAMPEAEGTRFKYTYFKFSVDLSGPRPVLIEVPDDQLLHRLEQAGCFDYLAEPGEDVYSPGDGEPL